jgi:hypothetical protein
MTAAAGHDADVAHSYALARQRKLRRTLESYGVLTRDDLREAVHADFWSVPFPIVLERAVQAGRVRQLSDKLFEAGPTG